MAETANPYIQGFDDPSVSGGIDVAENPTEMQIATAEQNQDIASRDLNIDKIRENAQIQQNLHRLQQILDEIRTQRTREITQKDIDATGQVQNGLFGWRALRRSYEGFIKNIVNASGDMSEAQRRLDSELMAQENPENLSTADRALEAFGQTCDQSQKQELTELMGMISDRYALEKQNGNATSEVMQKIEQTIMANSALLNMAIGAVFRTAFRSISHVGGLGGALLTSAIYGGASAGLRERRKARQEELSASAWKQELEMLETPEQKLGLLRQIAENPAKFRTYFEGRSAEAFEFFLLYQQTLSETDLQKIYEGSPPNIREIYAGKKIGARALAAAGRGALRSMTLSGIGYAITHGLSSLAHGELAMAEGGDDGDAEWKEQEPQYPITWREHLDQSPQTPRLELNDEGRFETGDNQYAEVVVEEKDTASADDIAKVITKDITEQGEGGSGESFEMNADQAEKFRNHIKEFLEKRDSDKTYDNGETIRVPASELNKALDKAGVKISDNLTYEAPEVPEAEADAPNPELQPGPSAEGEEAPAEGGASNEDGDSLAPPNQTEVPPADSERASQDNGYGGPPNSNSSPVPGGDENYGGAEGMQDEEIPPPDEKEPPEPLAGNKVAPQPAKAEADEEKNWIERIGGAKIIGLAILVAGAVEWRRGWRDVKAIRNGLGGVARWAGEKIAKARGGHNGSEESQETETDLAIQFSNELLSQIKQENNNNLTAVLWLGADQNQGLYEVTGRSNNPEKPLLVRSLKSDSEEFDHVVGRQLDDEDRWLLIDENELSRLRSLSSEDPEKALEEFKIMLKEARADDDSDDADEASGEERSDSEADMEIPELEPITDPSELNNYSIVYVLPDYRDVIRTLHGQTVNFKKIYGKAIIFERNQSERGADPPYFLTQEKAGLLCGVDERDLTTYFGIPKGEDKVLDADLDVDLDDNLPPPEPALRANTDQSPQQPAGEEASKQSDEQSVQDTEVRQPRYEDIDQVIELIQQIPSPNIDFNNPRDYRAAATWIQDNLPKIIDALSKIKELEDTDENSRMLFDRLNNNLKRIRLLEQSEEIRSVEDFLEKLKTIPIPNKYDIDDFNFSYDLIEKLMKDPDRSAVYYDEFGNIYKLSTQDGTYRWPFYLEPIVTHEATERHQRIMKTEEKEKIFFVTAQELERIKREKSIGFLVQRKIKKQVNPHIRRKNNNNQQGGRK